MNKVPSTEEIDQLDKIVTDMKVQQWLNEQLFTVRWWIILCALIIP